MQHLRLRTEYNFKRAYGPIQKVASRVKELGCISAGIADIGTWGHVAWDKACRSVGIKPIFGSEIAVVADERLKERQPQNFMAFLARTNDGLRELYELVTLSTENFYYAPRIDYNDIKGITDNIIILSGHSPNMDLLRPQRNLYFENTFLSSPDIRDHLIIEKNTVATADNFYPMAEDKTVYEIVLGKNREDRTKPMHIPSFHEMKSFGIHHGFSLSDELASECNAELPKSRLVKFNSDKTLEQICREAIHIRCKDWNDVYENRLTRELKLIKDKDYEDYFYVLWDAIHYAKKRMLVGPARGSSCGSLVCYLLSITEIDPIPYGLLFERFIDVTRKDLPDIDIDFADNRRELIFDYLEKKYGNDCVARLGTILRYKAKSAIGEVAKITMVPESDVAEVKNHVIERSAGDERANFCIKDTFLETDIGKEVIKKHSQMIYAADLENHASHSGQHAAGIVVTKDPVSWFCSFDKNKGALQVDKIDAERLNILKIDALGLRTLSVIQDILEQIGKSYEWLYGIPTNDKSSFSILNNKRYAGVFQFEGYALQGFASQMVFESLNDLVAVTALARPGPLGSGSANDYVERRTGKKETSYIHPLMEEYTKDTYGTIIYQEQVMQIVKNIGKFSWEDTSTVRKAISKSYGVEYLYKFLEKFRKGASENGLTEEQADSIWYHIKSMGSWAFNKSHAVAYGVVSYWCCYLKQHYPLEFAVANLRNAKDDQQSINLLREFHREGFKYKPFDLNQSEANWSIKNGVLIGGFTGIKGCGEKKAQTIIKKRLEGMSLTPSEMKMVSSPVTPWDDIFECQTKFGHMKENPKEFNIVTPIINISDIKNDTTGQFCIFGKIKEKKLRDVNEPASLSKRGGQKILVNNLWLNLVVEDDTGSIICSVDRFRYDKIGRYIIEKINEDEDWLLIKGFVVKGFKIVAIEKYRHLTKKE